MRKTVGFIFVFSGLFAFFGMGLFVVALSNISCTQNIQAPVSPKAVVQAQDVPPVPSATIPPDAVTICGRYVVSVSCIAESSCPPVPNEGCTVYADLSPEPTVIDTPVPTDTPLPTNTPVPTNTFTPVPTNTPIPTATGTITPPTNTATPIFTLTPVPTRTNTPTLTPIPTQTITPTPNPTICEACVDEKDSEDADAEQEFADDESTATETCGNVCLGVEFCEVRCESAAGLADGAVCGAKITAAYIEFQNCLHGNGCSDVLYN